MTNRCTDGAKTPMPFWQWKDQQYAHDQENGTPHQKEWYYRAYGGYRNKVRRENCMDAFRSRLIEEQTRPPLWARILMRVRFGPDSYCDNCGRRTWWNGNMSEATGIRLVFCDQCHARFIK